MKPDSVEDSGSKSSFTLLQSWLRQVTSSSRGHSTVPQCQQSGPAGSSKRRKGRPRKYVAAAGDRTLIGDFDATSDSGLGRFAVVPRAPSPRPPSRLSTERSPPSAPHALTTSGEGTLAVKRTTAGGRKDKAFQRGRRQPVKFIPAVERRPAVKPRRSTSSAVASTSSRGRVGVGTRAAGCVKRPRGRPRKHPLPSSSTATERNVASNTQLKLTDVEGDDSTDSDVIVTGYTAPRRGVTARGSQQPSSRRTSTSTAGKDSIGPVQAANDQRQTTNASELLVNTEVAQQPMKRKRGRPRKNPLPTSTVAVVSSSGGAKSAVTAAQRAASDDVRGATEQRRRVTRALTAAQIQHQWDASRSAADPSVTPATITPPLYYEISSSDNEELSPDFRSRVDRRQNNCGRKRKRRRSIPSRSLELSFSSIEKDDISGSEGAHHATSGQSRDSRESSVRAAGMTSTPRYDRCTSTKDWTLRSRWINVESRRQHRVTEATTETVRDSDVQRSVSTLSAVHCSNDVRTSDCRQSSTPSEVVHRRKRRCRRPSDSEDPDWRRYPNKRSSRPSRGSNVGPASSASASGTTPPVPSHHDHVDGPAYNDAELDMLVGLQRRLASTTDGHVLRRVVEIIETSGRYHVEDATFDFDLCSLDLGTINKLRHCLGV